VGRSSRRNPHRLISDGVQQSRLRIYHVRTALRHQESPPPRSITSGRMVTSICSSHTGVTASSHKTFPNTNADSLVQPWVMPTNRPIDARRLRVSSNVDSELPKRNFHKNVHTPSWVDPVPFRGTERQWTISNHWHNSTVPAAPTLGSMVCSLEPRAGKQLRVRRPGTRRPRRGSCATQLAQLCRCGERAAGDCPFNIQKPRVILLY
jgi:hypothetical protein